MELDDGFCVSSKSLVAKFFGKNVRTIGIWIDQGMPRESAGTNRYRYPLDKIVQWREMQNADRRPESPQPTEPSGARDVTVPDDDPLLLMADSYYGELYRKHKAKQVEIENEIKDGRLVRADAMRSFLSGFVSRLRQAGDVLTRQFGNDASQIMTDAFDDCMEQLNDDVFSERSGVEIE